MKTDTKVIMATSAAVYVGLTHINNKRKIRKLQKRTANLEETSRLVREMKPLRMAPLEMPKFNFDSPLRETMKTSHEFKFIID